MAIITSGLNQWKNKGKISNSNIQDKVRRLQTQILSARVISVNKGGNGNDGSITVELLEEAGNTLNNIIPEVLPLFPNIKNYPLENEVVVILSLANPSYSDSFDKPSYYYISPINLYNNPETNALPLPSENVKPPSQNKGYLLTQTGNPNKPNSQENTIFKAGTYFIEKGTTNPIYSYEGDTILDPRFGNSFRLGNTVPNGTTFIDNNWSSVGEIGDPITILVNGSHTQEPSFNSITEDINQDKSSIYLTSTQQIPIEVSSQNGYLSYSGSFNSTPNLYSGEQIILNSGRLLFNSTKDHILLSSAKSINLNTVESVNIDAKTKTIIQTPELYLGGIKTAQPIILGNDLVSLLTDLLNDLQALTGVMANQVGVPVSSPLIPTTLIAEAVRDNIPDYRRRLKDALSNTTKTV